MLQGKQNSNVHARETVLVRGEREHQLFAVVSKDRVRHCLCDRAEEAKSQGEVIVPVH